jgi:thiol-disulfide isomerase/thioredoxin
VSACTNKGLGVETTGKNIPQKRTTSVRLIEPSGRDRTPVFSGTTLDGTVIKSADLAGSITVVNFWASWCPPCRVEQRTLVNLWRDWKDRGVRFLGIDIRDYPVDAKAYLDEFAVGYPSIFNKDASIAFTFRVSTPPSTFVLDERGRIAASILGPVEDRAHLEDVLEELVK